MKKRILDRLCVVLTTLFMTLGLCACNGSDRGKVVFTTSLAKDELFRIGEVSCTMSEYMIYLVNTQNKYEDVFGKEIWGVTFEGVTFGDNIKDNVLARIAQMKSVYLLAQKKEVTLTEKEEMLLEEAAAKYFSSLPEVEAEAMGVTEKVVLQLYRENALADKVYQQIVSEVNPEISDDEARTITVEQILVKTNTRDSEGNIISYSEGMKAEALQKIQEIREMAIGGEQVFAELAAKYNEDENIRISFKKGEMDLALETVAFKLQTDEISEIVETTQGFYLLKCVNTFDKAETDANKLILIEQRKNEAFGKEYEAFVNTLARKLNDKLWKSIDLNHTDNMETKSFFDVYEDCLQKF